MLSGTHTRCHQNSIAAACTRPKLACSTHSRTHRRQATRCVNGQGAHIACASASHPDDSTAPFSQQQQQPEQLGSPLSQQQQQVAQQQAPSQQISMLLPPQQQEAAPFQQQREDWDAWLDYFESVDELGSQLDEACLELETAVAQEDYAAAADLKRSILSLLAQDAVAELNRRIQEALQAEDYSLVARLRNEGGAWLEGWWTCTDKKTGQLLRIAPEFGRWTARVYTAKDLAVIQGLVDEETADELLGQNPANQQVAAAAAASARVVASLRGQQQQSKGQQELQRALLLLGKPELEVFVRPALDTNDTVMHDHGNNSSDGSSSTAKERSSSAGSSAFLGDGLTGQQQQQYVMQAVGLGDLREKVIDRWLEEPMRWDTFVLKHTSRQWRGRASFGDDADVPADQSLDSDSDSGYSDPEVSDADNRDNDGSNVGGAEERNRADIVGRDRDREGSNVQEGAHFERWPLHITAPTRGTMITSPRSEYAKASLDRSYRRLTSHTSSSSSVSSSSSSNPLQGYFLGPAYLDREDPQLLLLQVGRCPDSNNVMLLGSTITGSFERPARHLFMRADVSPQTDKLPLELFPSKLGVTSRHPAEVRFSERETWDHAELLQLKQGRVRNEMTDGAELGLLWKPEGSSKHVMVLLHRVVLEEL